MRSLTELYKIAYGRIMWAKDGDYTGLCDLICTLLEDGMITFEEKERLKNSLKRNRPSEYRHTEFACLRDYEWEDWYWFPKGQIEHRRNFLKKMINYSKPWYIKLYLLWKEKLTEKT